MSGRYRWVVLAAGTLAQSSFSAVSVGIPALAPALRSHYGLTLGETGVMLGAVGIGMLPALLPWGLLTDRIGERAVIVVGLTGAAAALGGVSTTHTYGGALGLLVVAGALGGSVNAASGRAVMGWFGESERGLALGIRQAAVPVGGAVSAAALPWLASSGDTGPAFRGLAVACLAGALVAGVFLRGAPLEQPERIGDPRAPLRDATMWRLAGGSALYLTSQIAVTGFVVLFLHEHRGLSAHAAAAVLAGTNLLGVATRIGAGRWSDRLGVRVRPIRHVGAALALAVLLVAGLVDAPLAVLVPALLLAGGLGLTWNGLAFTATAETAGLERSGAALGFQQTLLSLLIAGVPPAFAALVDATSWRTGFALAAAGPLVGLLVLRGVPEPGATGRRGARTRGTSAPRSAAR